jgi:signal transduction histidine kinase
VLEPLPVSILLALVFTAAGLVELLTRDGVTVGQRPDDGILIALTVAAALSLALMWLTPLGALVASAVLLAVQSAAGYQFTQAAVWAVVIASFATAAFDGWRRAIAAGFIVAGGLTFVLFTTFGVTWQSALSTWFTLSVVWVVAVVIRLYRGSIERAERRAALFSEDREMRAREAVAEERTRLARELHDSVGHALNVVVLHAGAAQRIVDTRPDLAREALGSIETAGRQALGDIERMLGILRASDEAAGLDATPGLSQLEALCTRVREAGLVVQLDVEGERRELPSSLDLTAYRIVQEALTNTLKHAGKARASVTVRYGEDALEIVVMDDGRATPRRDPARIGHGLAGMRERVAIFGGELQAGPCAEGGFAVRALLPLAKEAS